MVFQYDIIIFGGGIAGLYTANRLRRAGYNLILIEKDTLGGAQTLASQGMIHGGQKYGLGGSVTGHSRSMAAMPARWDACFSGAGDVDLSGVHFLSRTQLMFPAASLMSGAARYTAYGNLDVSMMKDNPPWAARSNFNDRILLSSRVGCFTYNSIYSMDLAAACLK